MLHLKNGKDCDNSSDNTSSVVETAKEEILVRVFMNRKEVGAVIGKNGEIIEKLKKKTECNIYFLEATLFDRILYVIGTLSNVFRAFLEITHIVEKYYELYDNSMVKIPLLLKMIVPSSHCGIIIGKGGTTIKNIRKRSKCSILVSANMLPDSNEKTVSLSGSALSVSTAVFEIYQILSSDRLSREPVIRFKPLKTRDIKGNDNILASNEELAVFCSFLGKSTVKQLLLLINRFKFRYNKTKQMRRLTTSNNDVKIVKTITVPEDHLGAVIGTNGQNIHSVKMITKTRIKVLCPEAILQDDDGGLKRPIIIKGFPESVAVAEYLIDLCLDVKTNRDSKNLLLVPLISQWILNKD